MAEGTIHDSCEGCRHFQHIKEDMETHKELGRTYKFNFRGDVVLEVKATIKKPKEE